jgi:hypothetical protein
MIPVVFECPLFGLSPYVNVYWINGKRVVWAIHTTISGYWSN